MATLTPPHFRIARFALVSLLLVASPARAWDWDETRPSLRFALGLDVFRAAGAMVASARYGWNWNAKVGAWVRDAHVQPEAPNYYLGGGYVWTKAKWRFGAGVVWIDDINDINGTRWNFDLSVGYDLSDRLFFEYQHYSHGSLLGIDKGASNGSWNLMNVGLIF